MEQSFKALVVTGTSGNKFEREIKTRNISDLPEGEVLIKVRYSSLNYKDALSASGHKGITRKYPHTPGIDASGIVAESSDEGILPGDEVLVTGYDLGMNTSGGFGQFIRVPAEWVVKLPENINLKEAMIFGTAGFTAALSLYKLERAGLTPDMGTVLVTGASGGLGSLSVAVLSKCGYYVTAATGKSGAKDFLISLGAKEVIPREEVDDQSGKPLIKGRWAGVIDTAGGNILSTVIKSTKQRGVVACCGNVASVELNTTVFPFILRGIALLGIESAETLYCLRTQLWEKLASGWKPENLDSVYTECSLPELDEKIDKILKGGITGRVVVDLEG